MGLAEIWALQAKRTGFVPDPATHAPVKLSGPKPQQPLRKVSLKKQKENRDTKKAGGDPDTIALDAFFEAIAKDQEPKNCHCWECNAPVPDPFIRAATAHIFPKKTFRSVMTHPANHLILGGACCHDKSHKIKTFKKMGIWREAVDRFLIFKHLLTPKEKATKYYTLFLEAAKESFPQLFQNQGPSPA